ncbi:MAG: ATP-binding cassette domain-containing protein [Melioribacteraceae bacterium]|jgi:peptide/nickel transport system ATP-binding protein|nr:ATP-binding cassette domain-containing protein [Melioribacteraceae bacterium]
MVDLQNISYSVTDEKLFKNKSKQLLSNISISFNRGDIVGLIGESGAGKTTLAKIVAGVLEPTSGQMILNKITPKDVQILFQNSLDLINPLRKVISVLKDSKSISNMEVNIISFVKKVGLTESILDKFGYQLSGGERQRIALARLLLTFPKLLILDEPFSAQDSNSQTDLVKLFKKLNRELDITILCVSHDLNIMSSFPNKLGVMKNGSIIELGETRDVVSTPKHQYTKFLFKSLSFQLKIDDFNKAL